MFGGLWGFIIYISEPSHADISDDVLDDKGKFTGTCVRKVINSLFNYPWKNTVLVLIRGEYNARTYKYMDFFLKAELMCVYELLFWVIESGWKKSKTSKEKVADLWTSAQIGVAWYETSHNPSVQMAFV